MEKPAFQDLYPDHWAHCYGCGRLNEHGLHIRSFWDGDETVATIVPRPHHTAIPGFVYGGFIASVIDCHSTGSAAAAAHRSSGGDPAVGPYPRFLTGTLKVEYLKPTPIDCPRRAPVDDRRGEGAKGDRRDDPLLPRCRLRTRRGRPRPGPRHVGAESMRAFSSEHSGVLPRETRKTELTPGIPPAIALPPKSPEVLLDRGREIVARLGLPTDPTEDVLFFSPVRHAPAQAASPAAPAREGAIAPPSRLFAVYRQSPRLLLPRRASRTPSANDPPNDLPGRVSLQLGPEGRLLGLLYVPTEEDAAGPALPDPWPPLLAEAGLDPRALVPVPPRRLPLVPFDRRAAWTLPGGGSASGGGLEVTAATCGQRPVFFEVRGASGEPDSPWTTLAQPPRNAVVGSGFTLLTLLRGAAALPWTASLVQRGTGAGNLALFLGTGPFFGHVHGGAGRRIRPRPARPPRPERSRLFVLFPAGLLSLCSTSFTAILVPSLPGALSDPAGLVKPTHLGIAITLGVALWGFRMPLGPQPLFVREDL